MTIAIQPPPPLTFVPAPETVRRFTVEQYHRLIEAGAFDDGSPVELLEGWIVNQMGHNPPHDVVVKLVASMLDNALPDRWHTRVQSAITTADSEPLPDVAVVAGVARDYLTRHPGPGDVALAVEVSDTSLLRDRVEKAPLYARAAIPVYWIVNIAEGILEVYTDPTSKGAAGYRKTEHFDINASAPLVIQGQMIASIPVKEILP
jgi:Uma2 family endonuclease